MEDDMDIIPGLPSEMALACLARLPYADRVHFQCVSKCWQKTLRSHSLHLMRKNEGLLEEVLCLTITGKKGPATFFTAFKLEDEAKCFRIRIKPLEGRVCQMLKVVGVGSDMFLLGTFKLSFPEGSWFYKREVLKYDGIRGEWSTFTHLEGWGTVLKVAACEKERKLMVCSDHAHQSPSPHYIAILDLEKRCWKRVPPIEIAGSAAHVECMFCIETKFFAVTKESVTHSASLLEFVPCQNEWRLLYRLPAGMPQEFVDAVAIGTNVFSVDRMGRFGQTDIHTGAVLPASLHSDDEERERRETQVVVSQGKVCVLESFSALLPWGAGWGSFLEASILQQPAQVNTPLSFRRISLHCPEIEEYNGVLTGCAVITI